MNSSMATNLITEMKWIDFLTDTNYQNIQGERQTIPYDTIMMDNYAFVKTHSCTTQKTVWI